MEPRQQANPSEEVRLIRERLERAEAPVSVKKLEKELRSRHGWTAEQSAAALEAGVAAGEFYPWPAYRRTLRYWHHDPDAFISGSILEAAAEFAMSKRDLATNAARAAHRYGGSRTEAAISRLVKDGSLTRTRAIVGSGFLLYKTGVMTALLKTSAEAFRDRFRRLGFQEAEVTRAFGAPAASPPAATAPDSTERIVGILRAMERGPVTVYRLRGAVPDLSKKEFDAAILSLAGQQRVYLTRHDNPWSLPEEERERLVHDGGANLYVAVTLRD